jgi:hypothetical protein
MSSPELTTLADRIAKMLEAENRTPDLAALTASIEKLNARLDKLEAASQPPVVSSPIQITHPSTHKFSIAEAIADQIFDGLGKEKACQFEPSKPCDHCSMCSSRGF